MEWTTLLELAVFVVAFVALALSLYSLTVSHTDHLVLRRLNQNGAKRLTVQARVTRDVARVICAGAMLAASSVCLHYPSDNDTPAVAAKIGLLVAALFLAIAVVSDFRWRALIDAALERDNGE